jgi:hypothetical protein
MVRAHAPRQVTDENHEGGLDLNLLVLKQKKMLVKADAAGRLFLLAFLLYPGLTTKLFEGFICRDIGLGASRRRRRRHSAPSFAPVLAMALTDDAYAALYDCVPCTHARSQCCIIRQSQFAPSFTR